ncbi:hypothetical protein N7478_011789 [Penicillium angulare]|uniref:uncharacterized protein n=1 Tax=Penicillium angulare TaxID=116970 RepID=UPI00254213A7|nr:uncharacterized protein N7478_011789 [Penicillium angulare]KAJ5261194.1 hypothetical protein N7478_011789 [Penicillium angulare]
MLGLLAISSLLSLAAAEQQPWLKKSLPTEERLQSFLKQLNFTEKLSMVQGTQNLETNGCIGYVPGIDRLSMPAVCMGDGPEGVGNNLNNVTTFPAPVMTTAAWNLSLATRFGEALAQEHKAKGRNVVLAPTINIVRTPLWARAAESLSEDPYLNSLVGVAITKGIQSREMIACPKHLAAYNQDTNRFGVAPGFDAIDAIVDERTMQEVYLPAFKAAVQEGQAGSVMCSYNKVNGRHTCEDPWLYQVLKGDWGFDGFVVTDWYFAQRTTVAAALAGLDNSQPGGSLMDLYGFPELYGSVLQEAVNNGSVPTSRVEDMVERLWRPMFATGVIDRAVEGNETSIARTEKHLSLAKEIVEEGAVLLKNIDKTLPLHGDQYHSLAIFGGNADDQALVTELHGGFVLDTSMKVKKPLTYITERAAQENVSVSYLKAFPGTQTFDQVSTSMFGPDGLNVTYWTTTDWTGPVNQTTTAGNITVGDYPKNMASVWPDVYSSRYAGHFYPNETGLYYFSVYGNGLGNLYIDGDLVTSLNGSNFNMVAQGVVKLTAGKAVTLRLDYSMGFSVDNGIYGVTLGMDIEKDFNHDGLAKVAKQADLSIVFVNDEVTEGLDSNNALQLPTNQDELISKIAKHSKRTVVVVSTNSAILMPWLDEVDAVVETFYPGQEIGPAIARLLFGDVNFSGKLPITFPKALADTPTAEIERYPGVNLKANYSEGLFVGYRWFDENSVKPLFPFGFGLSYTEFELSKMTVKVGGKNEKFIEIKAEVHNTGNTFGQEVVQLYVQFPEECQEPPRLLKGFQKVAIDSKRKSKVEFTLGVDDLSIWTTASKKWKFVPGQYSFFVGTSSRDLPLKESVHLE